MKKGKGKGQEREREKEKGGKKKEKEMGGWRPHAFFFFLSRIPSKYNRHYPSICVWWYFDGIWERIFFAVGQILSRLGLFGAWYHNSLAALRRLSAIAS